MIEMTSQEFESLRKKAFARAEERTMAGMPVFDPAVECCAKLDCDGPGSCPA